MSAPDDRDDGRDDSKTSAIAAAILGAILTVLAAVTFDTQTATSVAVGAAIAVANLLTMRAIVQALIRSPEEEKKSGDGEQAPERDHRGAGRRGGVAWGVFAVIKILVLFGGIWFLLTKRIVAPIPLVVGYGVLPLGIVAAGVWSSLKPRS